MVIVKEWPVKRNIDIITVRSFSERFLDLFNEMKEQKMSAAQSVH
jgi:hypothetical protein